VMAPIRLTTKEQKMMYPVKEISGILPMGYFVVMSWSVIVFGAVCSQRVWELSGEIRKDEWNPRPGLGEIRIVVQEEGSQPLTPQAGCLEC
jgi:hypothetical protein